MSTDAQIFDFETSIERAVQSVFEAAGIIAWQPADDPALQKERPRVEINFITGPASGHLHPSALANSAFWAHLIGQGLTLNSTINTPPLAHDAYTGQLLLACFTKADHAEHVAYRAKVRHVAAALIYFIDPDHHEVMDITPAGSSVVGMNPEDGLYESRLQYTVAFAIKQTSWPIT